MISQEGAALGAQAVRMVRRRTFSEVDFHPGLTDAELDHVEQQFGFEFADDHRTFLAAVLPTCGGWPDWRDGDPDSLRGQLDWPVLGVLYDVKEDDYWHETWDERPNDLTEALSKAKAHLATVPRMVPVCGHRYLPAGRGSYGHPVLSMYQTDIIYYGRDLAEYVGHSFGSIATPKGEYAHRAATVPFWRDFL